MKTKLLINKIKNKFIHHKNYIILFIISIIIFAPYISNRFTYGQDAVFHKSNIYALDNYINISEGRLVPSKIEPVIAKNFGYGTGIFYPPLAYYITTYLFLIIKQIGLSLVTAIKIIQYLTLLLAGIFMYKLTKEVFNDKNISLLASSIYMCTPYILSNIFDRMAYAETLITLFLPITVLGIYYFLKGENRKFIVYFTVGYLGMLYSHLITTFYFTFMIFLILLFNIKKVFTKNAIISLLISGILIIICALPFLAPMLEHKINGNYTVFAEDKMTTLEKITKHSMNLEDYFNSNNYFNKSAYVFTNIAVIALAGISIVSMKRVLKNKDEKNVIVMLLIILALSIFVSSKVMPWDKLPKFLYIIQFPWRMCTFIGFSMSLLAALSLRVFNKNNIMIVIFIVSVICVKDAIMVVNTETFEKIPATTYEEASKVGRAMGNQKEYLPVNASSNLDYLENRSKNIVIKSGQADIYVIKDKTPLLEFEVKNIKENLKLELPRIFYLGYEIILNTVEGEKYKLEYYENDKGFIEINVPHEGKIVMDYKGTLLNKTVNGIAIVVLMISGVTYCAYSLKKRRIKSSERNN